MSATLYERLGGDSGIDALVDRIIDLHLANDTVSTRWSQLSADDMARSRAKAKEFFKHGSGGPVTYSGRSMREAHAGMNINEQEFLAVVDDMMDAMIELGYEKPERDEVVCIAYSLKDEIIRV